MLRSYGLWPQPKSARTWRREVGKEQGCDTKAQAQQNREGETGRKKRRNKKKSKNEKLEPKRGQECEIVQDRKSDWKPAAAASSFRGAVERVCIGQRHC